MARTHGSCFRARKLRTKNWRKKKLKQIFNHKESVLLSYLLCHCIKNVFRFVDTMHNLLEIFLAPSVPASLRNIPKQYIIVRLQSSLSINYYPFAKLCSVLL